MDIGGTRTAVAQQFAEVLSIPVENVIPQVADTDTIGYTSNHGRQRRGVQDRLGRVRGRQRR